MMKILILNDFFNENPEFLPKFLINFITYYKKLKLRNLIYSLKKRYNRNLKIEVVNAKKETFKFSNEINVEFFTDLRLKLERTDYLKIEKKNVKNTKHNLFFLFKNLIELKTLNYERIFIGKLLEYDLERFFNQVFGQFELLNRVLQRKKYDQIILVNIHPNSFEIFRELNQKHRNIRFCNDSFLIKYSLISKWLNISKYIFQILGSYFKQKLIENAKINRKLEKSKLNTIIFFADSKNQIDSLFPIYNALNKLKNINLIFYRFEHYLPLGNLIKLFRFLFQIDNILKGEKKSILTNLAYNSIFVGDILKIFYNSHLFILLIKIFNIKNNLNKFLKVNPKLVVIANDFKIAGRLTANFFKLYNIPTLYIPHAAVPIIEDLVTKSDINYFAFGGEMDKHYYASRGVSKDSIEIVGVPRYEHFYKGEIQEIVEIKDKFENNKFNFKSKNFSIILTTNAFDDFSNEKIITSVINTLKELDIVENLFIKLHPREDGILHKKVLRDLNVNTVVVKDYNTLELIKSSDLLLSSKSTTLLEAMIIGTPIIYLDFINEEFAEASKYNFLDEDLIITVRNEKELLQKVQELIFNKEMIKKYC